MPTRLALACVILLYAAAGCTRQLNNPFVDSGAWDRAEFTTPSAEGFRARHATEVQLQRVYPKTLVYGRNGYVTHWPIWWEDPFVDKGNDATDPADRDRPDPCFAINLVDYLALAYCPARFALNTVAWPISAIVTPPGTLMVSDGRLSCGPFGYYHDATRATPGLEPPDQATSIIYTEVVEDTDAAPPLPLPPVTPLAPPMRVPSTQRR